MFYVVVYVLSVNEALGFRYSTKINQFCFQHTRFNWIILSEM